MSILIETQKNDLHAANESYIIMLRMISQSILVAHALEHDGFIGFMQNLIICA